MALKDDITTAASNAKRLKLKDKEREAHSLKDMIAADQYVSNQDAIAGTKRRGLIITKLRPPGTTS